MGAYFTGTSTSEPEYDSSAREPLLALLPGVSDTQCVCVCVWVCVCVKERECGGVTTERHTEPQRPILTFHLQHQPFTHLTLTKARIHSYAHTHTHSLRCA